MPIDKTLFAHIARTHTDKVENVAVRALGHILSQSEAAREALAETLQLGGTEVGLLGKVQTQATGEKGGIPDLSVKADDGTEPVLIEAKFDAPLTPNQPNGYLEQLPRCRPAALLFVAPAARIETLWPVLRKRAEEVYKLTVSSEFGKLRSASIACGERRLMLTSWADLLDRMETKANKAGDTAAEADIIQLRGLTDQMDAEIFLPWRSEDLGPEFARRMLSLIAFVDDSTDRGCDVGFLDIRGNDRQPRYEGYGRHMEIGGVAAWFGYIFDGWAQHENTPLWLLFKPDTLEHLQKAGLAETRVVQWRTKDWRYCIPIALPTRVERENALDSVVASLREIAEQLMASDA
ncbi:MAG: hypothetical protein OXC27_17370 [Caldilineaceae bacterium]|nr:hypothetical protein [Caldilineaceae bacterium]